MRTFCWQTSSTADDLVALTNPDSNLWTRRRLQGKSSCSDVPRCSAKHSVWVLTMLTGFPFLSCYCAAGFTHWVKIDLWLLGVIIPTGWSSQCFTVKRNLTPGYKWDCQGVKTQHLETRGVVPSNKMAVWAVPQIWNSNKRAVFSHLSNIWRDIFQ